MGQTQMSAMVVLGGWDGDRALETVEMFDQRTGQWNFLPNMMGEIVMLLNHNLVTIVLFQFPEEIMEQQFWESFCTW